MRTIRTIASVLLLVGLASEGIRAQSMFVKEKSGNLITYSLGNVRKLTFTPENLHVSRFMGSADDFILGEIRFLTFSDVIIGIDHPDRGDLKSGFRIFPNPVKEFLTISSHPDEILHGLVEVAGLDGSVIKSFEVSNVSELKIDVRGLVDGVYICRFINEKGWHTEKFLKTQ